MSQPRGDLQLAIGYWIVSHKDQLRTWWAVTLLTIIAGSMLWAIGFFSVFFVQQVNLEKIIRSSAAGLAAYRQSAAVAPTAVTMSDVTVIRRDQTHVDLVAIATNPNGEWGIESATARWQVAGVTIPDETVFVNPSAIRPLLAMNVTVPDAALVHASVGVSDIIWARASASPLPNPVFSTVDLGLSPRTVQTPDGENITTVNVHGDMMNQSVYNFFRVIVPILVKSGERIVAVDQVTQTAWPTLSKKTLNVTWSYSVVGATAVEAWPQVSRFDAANLYR